MNGKRLLLGVLSSKKFHLSADIPIWVRFHAVHGKIFLLSTYLLLHVTYTESDGEFHFAKG